MASDRGRPRVGDVVRFTLGAENECEPFRRAEYRIESAPNCSPTAHAREASRTYRTQLLSEQRRTEPSHVVRAGMGTGASADEFLIERSQWHFIRENRPVLQGGLGTSVLAAGSSQLDYRGARSDHSPVWLLRVRDTVQSSPDYIRIRFRLEAAHYAMPVRRDIPRGHYLARVQVNVLECVANWPSWIDASASVEGAVDRGTRSNRIPEVIVRVKFSWGWIGSAHRQGCAFRVNGLTGCAPAEERALRSPLPTS